jgi:hypothetical protein
MEITSKRLLLQGLTSYDCACSGFLVFLHPLTVRTCRDGRGEVFFAGEKQAIVDFQLTIGMEPLN